MMRHIARAVLLAVSGLAGAATPALAIDGDTQLWNTTNFNYKIDDKWSANLEVQERWYDDVSYFAFLIIRPSVSYKWNDWLTLTGGYAFFRVYDEDGGFADEDRTWQQAGVRLFGGKDKPTLGWRTRLEQRFFEGVDEPTWRLREQLRYTHPLTDRVTGVAWTEAFWRLNTTERAEADLEQWRNFAGLNIEISEKITFEAGYMNVYTWRTSGDTSDHVPWLITTFKF